MTCLAIDKQGSLVLIENKLDDSGRDVTWQALKYASYCSGLSKENVRGIYQEFLDKTELGADAKQQMTEFLEAHRSDDLGPKLAPDPEAVLFLGRACHLIE